MGNLNSKDNLLWLRRIHGSIIERRNKKKEKDFDDHIVEIGLKRSLELSKDICAEEIDYPVDFVVTWVDGNDQEWQAARLQYDSTLDGKEGNTKVRWRDWNTFVYWFRSVEKYAPWVNNVFLVVSGDSQIPKWLNLDHPKLKVIKHNDFIPDKYLPTFNITPIELNLHRIPGLSDHFIYFNDDWILNRQTKPSDFFYEGKIRYPLIAIPNMPREDMTYYEHMRFTNAGVINSRFSFRQVIIDNLDKWFSVQYTEKENMLNKRVYEDGFITGLYFTHLPYPFTKNAYTEVWSECEGILNRSCMDKFRSPMTVTAFLFIAWTLCKGDFCPVSKNYYGLARNFTMRYYKEIVDAIKNGQEMTVCYNDCEQISDEDFVYLQNIIYKTLGKKLPEKSMFEI